MAQSDSEDDGEFQAQPWWLFCGCSLLPGGMDPVHHQLYIQLIITICTKRISVGDCEGCSFAALTSVPTQSQIVAVKHCGNTVTALRLPGKGQLIASTSVLYSA